MAAGTSGSRVTDPKVGPEPIQLGAVSVLTPAVLAPMAGVTDQPFRALCRQFSESGLPNEVRGRAGDPLTAAGGLFVTEMVTARGLLEGSPRSWGMVAPEGGEQVRSIQLYGTDPTTAGRAAALLVERGLAHHIDLNFGCPVPKVTRKGGGAAIPWKRDLFSDMVSSVVRAVDQASGTQGEVPVTVKMRLGTDDDHMTALEAGKLAENAGAAAVGLHARTHAQYYSGSARWEWITRLKDHLNIPVLGNGDVFSAEDALAMMEETGCDGVIIGRGCQGRPWLFEEISAAMWGEEPPPEPTLGQVADVLFAHASATVASDEEERVMKRMRKHIAWYLRGFPIGGETRRALQRVGTLEELKAGLETLDPATPFPEEARGARGRAGSSRTPHLPHGWLDSRYLTEDERENLIFAEDDVSGG